MIEFLAFAALAMALAIAAMVFVVRDIALWKDEDDWQDDEAC